MPTQTPLEKREEPGFVARERTLPLGKELHTGTRGKREGATIERVVR